MARKTLMEWIKVSPIWYVVFGILLIAAGIYSIVKPDLFGKDGVLDYAINVAMFFGLGGILIWYGLKQQKK